MRNDKRCAYCNSGGPFTREHIWPSSIVKRVEERARYSPKASALVWSDLVIKDVCARCNNGPLADLDSYGASLFDRYFCDYVMTISDAVRFEYDYALLARWLLKLSYNSARSVGSDVERLSRYALTIKDPTATLPDDFSMKADLVLPSKEPQSNREIIPASNRLCKISFSSGIDDWCTVRLVAINSYYFWILMQDKSDHSVNRDHAMAIVSKIPGVPVRRSYTIAQLRPSGATTFDMHSTWAAALRAQAIPDKM